MNNNSTKFSDWLSKKGINFEDSYTANKNGLVAFNAFEPGNYVTAIYHPGRDGGFVNVFEFSEYKITYTYTNTNHTQDASLYLCIGGAFLFAGITTPLVPLLRQRKRLTQTKGVKNRQ